MSLSRPASLQSVVSPFDFEASRANLGWRDSLIWPVSHRKTFDACRAVTAAGLDSIDQIGDETLCHAALLGLGKTLAEARHLAEMALVVQAEAEAGIRLDGGPPELALLRGESSIDSISNGSSPFKSIASPRHLLLRRIARVASWTPTWRIPHAMITPDATAISHNATLIGAARHGSLSIGFRHAESLLVEARKFAVTPSGDFAAQAEDFAELVSLRISQIEGLNTTYRERLREIIRPKVAPPILHAAADLAGFRNVLTLPEHLWSGTGGYYPSRAAGIEVRRRGGDVTRFAHGWFSGMANVVEPIVFSDLVVCNRYVLETPVAARNFQNAGAAQVMPRSTSVEIIGHRGASHLAALPLNASHARDSRSRPRLVYAPTILRGHRQFVPPLLPDVIYLDWQFRLVEMLADMPVDLLCKPHPEGLLRGQPHPLSEITLTSNAPFEDHMAEADLFLFDYGQSTTFAEALCSDRPVIFIDMGNPAFNDAARSKIEKRCRVIRARFDERNRPMIDPGELSEALLGGSGCADPTECRALLMGVEEA